MVGFDLFIEFLFSRVDFSHATEYQQKTDVAEYLEVFHHAGLLVNEPPSTAGLLFI